MILSFKMKGAVISDHFSMLWFQKDSLYTVGFRTFRGGGGWGGRGRGRDSQIKSWFLVDQSDIWIPKCTESTGLGNFPKFYQFFFDVP